MKMIWNKPRGSYHGRPKELWRGEGDCEVCGRDAIVLGFDSSDDEYGPFWVCELCAHQAFTDGRVPQSGTEEKP